MDGSRTLKYSKQQTDEHGSGHFSRAGTYHYIGYQVTCVYGQ